MKHLLKREDYIKEYLHNVVDDSDFIYEGLISTLFGGLKMLLKKDWENIKCKNPTVLAYLKEIDKSLEGYTFTKMQYSSECKNIRQNVADYFNDILDYKLSQIENIENEDDANEFIEKENEDNEEQLKGVAKILKLKDDTILDNIKKYKENISSFCKPSSKLREYADQLLNSVTVFVNDIIIKELEKKGADKAKLDAKRKKTEEEKKKLEEIRNKMNKLAGDADAKSLKKINDERDKAFKNLNIKPIGAMSGDKSIDTIVKQFNSMLKEFDAVNESVLPQKFSEILRSDTYIGIQNSFDKVDNEMDFSNSFGKFFVKIILNKIDDTFKEISNNKGMFVDVPSASVQAMMVSLSNVVIYGFIGEDKFNIKNNKDMISLITKCAIDSDATIGFNLPLIDPKKPDNGNFFVSRMNQFKNIEIKPNEVEDVIKHMGEEEIKKIIKEWNKIKNGKIKDKSEFIKEFSSVMKKDFRQNITSLFDVIVKTAKTIKEKAEKKAESAKAQQESESQE